MDSDLKQRTMSGTPDSLSSSQLSDVLGQLENKDVETSVAAQQLLKRRLQSTRESWLLNGLWDHCMKGCSENLCKLIASTPDMHSGRLFDKLNDGLVKQKTRLSSLTVLGYLIRQQPTWLYKIAGTTLFTTIIRCLKSEHDIPILMNALLAVTALLPTIPVAVGPFLPQLFYIFMRLMMICSTGYLGDIPEVLIVHLRVGVYSFFHRLYAMYPKNFISYLQDQYASRHAHVMETRDAIQPLLLSVRLNPQLIVGSQQLETSTSKWRGFDAQAIETECSKLSVDAHLGHVNYTGDLFTNLTEMYTKIQFPRPMTYPAIQQKSPCQTNSPYVSQKSNPIQKVGSGSSQCDSGLVSDNDGRLSLSVGESSDVFRSPSIALGLSTPPPSRSISPSGSSHDLGSLMPSRLGDDLSRRSTLSSNINYNDASRILPDTESLVSTTSAPAQSSSTRSSTVASRRGSGTSGSGRQSPSKCTSLPAVSGKQDMQHEGLLSDDKDGEVLDHVVAALSSSPKVVLHPDGKEATVSYDAVSHDGADSAAMTKVDNTDGSTLETFAVQSKENDKQGKCLHSHHLSLFHLNDIGDKTQFNHSDTQAKLLAQIRLQGSNPSIPSMGNHFRSVSLDCSYSLPTSTFKKHNSTESISDVLQPCSLPPNSVARPAHMWKGIKSGSCSTESLLEMRSVKHRCALYSPMDSNPTSSLTKQPDQSVDSNHGHDCKSSAILEVSQEVHSSDLVIDVFSLDDCVESIHVCHPDSLPCEQEQGKEAASSDTGDRSPKRSVSFTDFSSPQTVVRTFSHLLPSALPVPAVVSENTSEPEVGQRPSGHGNESGTTATHSQLAPGEILDRLLELGSALHAKKSSSIPMTYLEGTDWSHFGESPQADEVAILKSQVLLLYAQLMYERHHGQQHARRNRSLLSRAFRAAKMEEELWALKEQVQMQQSDIQRIAAQAMFEIEHEQAKLDNSQKLEQLLQHQLKICVDENQVLQETEASAVEKAQSIQAELDRQQEVLHKMNAKVFYLESSLDDLSPKAEVAEQLQQQVDILSFEVLKLNGILDDYKQIERESEMLSAHLAESEMALSTAKNELRQSQDKLQQQTGQLMMLTAKVEEQDATISNMTQTTKQQKMMIENVKRHCSSQLQAVEERCSALEVANQRLEAHIMEMYGQREHNSSGHRIHVTGTGSESSSLSSTPGTGALATLFSRSPDSYSAIPPP